MIAALQGSEAVAMLAAALRDADPDVREVAVEALADRGGAAIDELAFALHDVDAKVRFEAIDALAEIDSDEARSLLQLALADVDPRIRAAAAELLD